MVHRSGDYVLAAEAEQILRTAVWLKDSADRFHRMNPTKESKIWVDRAEDKIAEALSKVRRLLI